MNDYRIPEKQVFELRVLNIERWTPRLWTFSIVRPAGFRFAAGQYVRLGLEHQGQKVWRAYSLVSAPDEDELEFFSVLVPGGAFSTELAHLQPGSAIWMESEIYGFMTPDRFAGGSELWMLATGTGLGPFISILRTEGIWQRFQRLIVVHCVRTEDELAYADELSRMQSVPRAADEARLSVVQCVTRSALTSPAAQLDPQRMPRLHERITTALESGALERAAGAKLDVENSRVMLCGNPQMIDEMRRLLHARGFTPCRRATPGQFLTENYW